MFVIKKVVAWATDMSQSVKFKVQRILAVKLNGHKIIHLVDF